MPNVQMHDGITSIPLREKVTVRLQLPINLTRKEAEKVAAVIRALATKTK